MSYDLMAHPRRLIHRDREDRNLVISMDLLEIERRVMAGVITGRTTCSGTADPVILSLDFADAEARVVRWMNEQDFLKKELFALDHCPEPMNWRKRKKLWKRRHLWRNKSNRSLRTFCQVTCIPTPRWSNLDA